MEKVCRTLMSRPADCKEYLKRQADILKLLEAEPIFNKSVNYYQGREDRLKRALERGKRSTQLAKQYKWGMEEYV